MEQTTHDMSEYSDRLWKIAYERGKAEKLQEVMDILDIMLDEDMVARIREWIDHTDNKVVAESATTTDCISRKQAIEAIEGVDWYHVNPKGELVSGSTSDEESWYKAEDVYKALESLPPVEPKIYGNEHNCIITMFGECSYSETGCGSCEVVAKVFEALKDECPPVTPKPVCEDAVSKGELMTSLQGIWDAYTPNNMTDFQDVLEDIYYKIKNAPSVTPTERTGEWIPVSVRLPEEAEIVLGTFYYDDESECAVHETYLTNAKRLIWGHNPTNEVIAWQPLPEPYKAESEEV